MNCQPDTDRVCHQCLLGSLELHMHDSLIIYDSQFTRTQLSRIAYGADADAEAEAEADAASKSNHWQREDFRVPLLFACIFYALYAFLCSGNTSPGCMDCGLTASMLCLLSDSCALCKLNEVQIYYLLIDLSSK